MITDDEMPESTSWVLRNDLVELERLGDLLAAFAQRCGWPELTTRELELALDEVVTNIISYAYEDEASHEIRVRVASAEGRIIVEVEDDGVPFDPVSSAPEPVIDGAMDARPIGGLGWHLVRSVVDELRYRREAGKNIVTLTRTRATTP